jgi:hypothetical protein
VSGGARTALEALQERRRLARLELGKEPAASTAQLAHELSLYRTALERSGRAARRSTSQRVAMFGFLLLFVGPITAMFGTALGRLLHSEPWAAGCALGLGLGSVAILLVPALFARVVRSASPRWRLLARATEINRQAL